MSSDNKEMGERLSKEKKLKENARKKPQLKNRLKIQKREWKAETANGFTQETPKGP